MKIFYKILVLIIFCAVITSCSTSQTISVFGNPGTEIYSPDMKKVGVVDNNGTANIKISSDDYYAYLMTYNQSTKELVPFALDYKYCGYYGDDFLTYTGGTLVTAGLVGCIGGVAAFCTGADDIASQFLVAGGGATLLGTCIVMPGVFRSNQTQHEWKYKYLPRHQTNEKFQFTYPMDYAEINKPTILQTEVSTKTNPTEEQTSAEGVSKVTPRTSKSTRSIKNYGKMVMGDYVGSGKLLQGETVIESYNDMVVSLKRVDNNTVTVKVIDNEGVSFFSSISNYSIRKKDNGDYELTLKGIPSAKISIYKNKKLTYVHPKVNIDDELYTLEISAILK